jgi:hypothetical protein
MGFESPEQFFGTMEDAQKAQALMSRRGDGENGAEAQKLALEKEKNQAQLAFQREKSQAELALRREEAQADVIIKRLELLMEQQTEAQRMQMEAALAKQKQELEARLDAMEIMSGKMNSGTGIVPEAGV